MAQTITRPPRSFPPAGRRVRGISRRGLLSGLGAAVFGVPATIAALRLAALDPGAIAAASAQDISYFRIGAGVVGSRLYQLAGTLAGAITNPPGSSACDEHAPCGVPDLIALAQTTAGSVENLQGLGDGSIESGVVQTDIILAAMAGTGPFKAAGPNPGLRVLTRLSQAGIHVAVPANSPVAKIADLKGRTIALGPKNGDSALTAQKLLAAYDLAGKRVKLDFRDTQSTIAGFADGKIDALIVVDGAPSADLTSLAERGGIRLLPIDGSPAARLRKDFPYLEPGTIRGDLYKGADAVDTLAVPILWAVSAKLGNNLAFNLVKALWGQNEASGGTGKPAADLDVELATDTGPVPLHAGAKTYYQGRKTPPSSTN